MTHHPHFPPPVDPPATPAHAAGHIAGHAAAPSPRRRGVKAVALAVAATTAMAVGGGAGYVLGAHTETLTMSGGTPEGWDGEPSTDDPTGSRAAPPDLDVEGSRGPGLSSDDTDAVPATEDEERGVVIIETQLDGGSGAGTGFVVAPGGTVLTAYHVVDGSTSVAVTDAATGLTYAADVVGSDPTLDVAVLQLQGAPDLETVTLDSDGVEIGEAVSTVGNARGQGFLTTTDGEVLSEDEEITTQGDMGESQFDGLISADAYAVSGDSGGPLIDADGEVVALTIAASTGGEVLTFSVPIEDAVAVWEQVESGVETDTVRIGPGAYLGIGATNAPDGVYVEEVDDASAASVAGLSAGDTITAIDGVEMSQVSDLTTLLDLRNAGDEVNLEWISAAGEMQSFAVVLGESPLN